MTRALILLTLAALILAAGTVALWSQGAPGRMSFDGGSRDAVAGPPPAGWRR